MGGCLGGVCVVKGEKGGRGGGGGDEDEQQQGREGEKEEEEEEAEEEEKKEEMCVWFGGRGEGGNFAAHYPQRAGWRLRWHRPSTSRCRPVCHHVPEQGWRRVSGSSGQSSQFRGEDAVGWEDHSISWKEGKGGGLKEWVGGEK